MLKDWLKASALFLSGYYRIYDINHCLVLREELLMAVKNAGENYKCNVCGNEVTVTKAGGGELVCCGQPMEKISG